MPWTNSYHTVTSFGLGSWSTHHNTLLFFCIMSDGPCYFWVSHWLSQENFHASSNLPHKHILCLKFFSDSWRLLISIPHEVWRVHLLIFRGVLQGKVLFVCACELSRIISRLKLKKSLFGMCVQPRHFCSYVLLLLIAYCLKLEQGRKVGVPLLTWHARSIQTLVQ